MPENAKKPQIRFKGFTDAWEQRKLGNLVIDTIDNRGKNPPYYCESGIPIIDNFMIKNSGYPDLSTATRYIDDFLFENFIRKYNEIDDTLITLVGNGIGQIALFPKGKSAIIQNTLGLRFSEDKIFMYYILLSKHSEIVKLDRGMAQPSIRQDELKDVNLNIPKRKEQFLLGKYFRNLDNLITLHQRKLDKLKNIKKSMLEKMFPKNGSNVPEIRFTGFTDAWEQRKLENITDRYDNLRIPVAANLRIHGNTPYYGANGIQDYVEGYTHDGEFILIAEDGANDLKNYPVNYVDGRIWVNNHAHVLQAKKDCSDNKFLSYAINRTDIESLLVGGSRAKLNADTLMNILILLPTRKEQIKIGIYLNYIDNLITLHQRKIKNVLHKNTTINLFVR